MRQLDVAGKLKSRRREANRSHYNYCLLPNSSAYHRVVDRKPREHELSSGKRTAD
ncbi:hypothetical protein BAUCODRAFT_35911 [Baudoinia panamericana UAMH 10762]|uniref:Uncharacterized protein n=1 Tax=Baudoinia panamericana (strain UAMH 10762) TaxID=717646 RepID=M2N6J9_BAUPA|nr:uncharacterized protein BAUCODRAFT_35911 [Baudoinia panamericana UAMH 10762]EMC94684.1 hypothetical protein BAUCODRAFT_35911 [Baudoinia panamericana UAMH 10762]